MRRLYWLRHGPTHQTAFTGWRDVAADLSDTAAIARLQAFLPDAPVVSSDLIRAVATADAIQETRQRLPHERDLREFDFGAWDGLQFQTVVERDPEISRAFWETPGDVAPPKGESWKTVADRVVRAIDRIWSLTDGDLVAVAHVGTIMCHTARVTGARPEAMIGNKIDTLSVTVLEHDGKGWRLERINHLP